MIDRSDKDKLQDKTNDFVKKLYAKMEIANSYGIIISYSFRELNQKMNEENKSRQEMKSNNQVFFGPVNFTLETYFSFWISRIEVDTKNKIAENATIEITELAKNYYSINKDQYIEDEQIVYDIINENAELERHKISHAEKRFLSRTDPELLILLDRLEEKMTGEYKKGEKLTRVIIISKWKSYIPYEKISYNVIRDFIDNIFYNELITKILKNA